MLYYGYLRNKDVTPAITAEINKSVSTAEKEASENYKKRRPPLNYTEIGVPISTRLVFSYGVTLTELFVSSDRKVKTIDIDEEKSLSQVTREILIWIIIYNLKDIGVMKVNRVMFIIMRLILLWGE